jgi:PAS domain S-box-containing protein
MSDAFRWQALFQRVREPVFVLNRNRRLLFVNRAWEELTGVSATKARGLACTRRASAGDEPNAVVTRTLWPPQEVLQGRPAFVRRRVGGSSAWWDIDFLPLRGEEGVLCILGRISGVPLTATAGYVPFPDALRTLHDGIIRKLPADQAAKVWKPDQLIALRERLAALHRLDLIESELPSMHRVREQARLASRARACVFIVGEPGTGKRWLARAIHQLGSSREKGFAALDCARLSLTALSEALFGSSGLCERPGIGSLYIRDPARLPHDLQARLRDWAAQADANDEMQRPHLIAGSCNPPMDDVRAGQLLEELHATLSTLLIDLPSLRERMADLPGLVTGMLDRFNAESERRITGLTPSAWEIVREYRWPGNVRELYVTLFDCHGRATGDHIDTADLPAGLRQAVHLEQTTSPAAERPIPLDSLLEQAERRLIELALHRARGNKSRAADLLAVWRPRLLRRMEALGIKHSAEPDA